MDGYKELLDFIRERGDSYDTFDIKNIKDEIEACNKLKRSDDKDEIISFLYKLNLDYEYNKSFNKSYGYHIRDFYDMNMIELKLYLDISKDLLQKRADDMIHEYLLVENNT